MIEDNIYFYKKNSLFMLITVKKYFELPTVNAFTQINTITHKD